MDTKQNPFTLDWVADTFLDLLIKGHVVDPVATMKSLLDARAEFAQALHFEVTQPSGLPSSAEGAEDSRQILSEIARKINEATLPRTLYATPTYGQFEQKLPNDELTENPSKKF